MGSATERPTKLDHLLGFLRSGGIWLCLAMLSLLAAIFLGDKDHWPVVAWLGGLGLIASAVAWFVQHRRESKPYRNTLSTELAEVSKLPDEPTLTERQNVMVCLAWDHHPFGLEDRQFVEDFPMSDDDLEDALNLLVKWDYLERRDGRGPMGESNDPDTYIITKKGRRYVEAKWPNRGDARRQKIHRRRLKAGR